MKKILFIVGAMMLVGAGIFGVSHIAQEKDTTADSRKIAIITTLFPQYDFAKAVGGDKVDVALLLPPGVEAHAYEPKPSDISKINSADIFVYTGEFMEPWAHDIIKGVDTKVKVVDASAGVTLMEEEEGDEHREEIGHEDEDGHPHSGVDPHIWLDFENASIMAKNIAEALSQVDPENAEYYQNNLRAYQSALAELDVAYKNTLSTCTSKTIIYGGHYAFGYMAKRYGLEYVSAQGFSPDAEPSVKDMIALVEQVKKEKIGYLFYEELTSPKIAETLAHETNTTLLLLNGAHNLTKEEYQSGATFISLMKENLTNLSQGLTCKK